MIAVVTPNPALDTTYRVGGLRVGQVQRVDSPAVRAGGKGVNVARVLTQLGRDALAVSPVGDGPNGAAFAAELAGAGIRHLLIDAAADTRRSIALVDDETGLTTVLNEHGAPLSEAETAALVDAVRSAAGGAQVVVCSGSLPPAMSPNVPAQLVRDAHAAGAAAIVDATGPALLEACRAGADAVKPNVDELRETVGDGDPVAGARRLLAEGARLVVVTLGGEGMLAVSTSDTGRVVHAALPAPLEGNPTGAGDAAIAAIAAGLAAGEHDSAALLRRAVAWSGAAVRHPLAGSLADGWEDLAEQVIVKELS